MTHWYRGQWGRVRHDTPRTDYSGPDKHARARSSRTPHTGEIGGHFYEDNGTRLARSVLFAKSVRGGLHRTQKPAEIVSPLIEYACPPDGLVVDMFTGSGRCWTLRGGPDGARSVSSLKNREQRRRRCASRRWC